MTENSTNMVKMLKIVEYLTQESSEEKPATTADIIGMLEESGISCDRRTLYKNMNVLREEGYNIITTKVGHQNAYYMPDRSFSNSELKMLIDAVMAAKSITKKQSDELIDKLANLARTKRKEVLRENIVCFNSCKHSNEDVFDNIDKITKAIRKSRGLVFSYFQFDVNKNHIYKHGNKKYKEDSIGLIYNDGNYYMISYNNKHKGTATYRVDHMEEIKVDARSISAEAKKVKKNWKPERYTASSFWMDGEPNGRIK